MESEKPSSLQHCRASTYVTVARNWIRELVSGNKPLFIPDVMERNNRFQVKYPGRFFCCVTGLVFVMKSNGEVIYRFCSWEKALKTLGSWSPAEPLFIIECPQGTLKELHLPHCEISADENLAAAHVTKDNTEILQPQEVRGQVLLLLRPVAKVLNVFLLPLDVPPDQVRQQEEQKRNDLILTSSKCKLVLNQRYRISCDHEALKKIQPENEEFECNIRQPIYPTFEVFLNCDVMEMELSVLEDRSSKVVWRRLINFTGVAFVDQHREAIIQRVSLIKPILDGLYEHIEGEKYTYIRAPDTSQEKMRRLYEVLNTDRLKELFYDSLEKNEPHLVLHLNSLN